MLSVINVTLDSYNILISFIFFISIVYRNHLSDKVQEAFKYLALFNTIMAAANLLANLFQGAFHPINFIILPAAIFLFYISSFAILINMAVEILIFINIQKLLKFARTSLITLSAIFLILLIITPFTGFLYTIDESNIYSRGPFLFTAAIIEVLIQLTLIIYLWVNRKNIHPKKFEIVYGFVLFPLLMQILQIATNGIALVTTGFSISFILMFIVSQHSIEASLDYREVELAEKEVELLNKVSESQQTKFEIIKMQNHTIESLSNLVENRDEDTGEHVVRTRAYVEMIAIALMKKGLFPETITPKYISLLKRAAPMHDIGKIVVPDAILKKPGRFTEEEFNLMKKHVSEGGRIVHEIMDGYEDPEYIQITVDIATHHHERWDGTGYPSKLKGEEIPLCARIMALADVFDALVSPRVYKSPMSYNEAFGIIEENKGKIFDPVISQEFLNLREKAIAINESFKEK